ncbi:MAG: hypothetical protein E7056_02970 [Lentisphaerae bacterium]|nr:hypothetical protein [Lentisphaerota bacterium]
MRRILAVIFLSACFCGAVYAQESEKFAKPMVSIAPQRVGKSSGGQKAANKVFPTFRVVDKNKTQVVSPPQNSSAKQSEPGSSKTPGRQPDDKRLVKVYGDWEAYMLGIDTPEKAALLKLHFKRIPRIALVGSSGLNAGKLAERLKNNSSIKYIVGSEKSCRSMHDVFQISELLLVAEKLFCPLEIQVYQAAGSANLAQAFDQAGKSADIVITYHSFWHNVEPLLKSVEANPDTLYIAPYGEVGPQYFSGQAFQGHGRHPDGSGVRNLITTIPLARDGKGRLLTVSKRNGKDSQTINFIAPSSYAHTPGTTCPSVGVTAAVAAWIVSCAGNADITAEEIITLMKDNVSIPEERMLNIINYNQACVNTLRSEIRRFADIDDTNIRRLEAEGVLDLWKICQAMSSQGLFESDRE